MTDNPTPEQYQRYLDRLKEFKAIPVSDPEYHEKVAALKQKRLAEKALLVVPDTPGYDTRWCDPRSERFPYLVAKGWVPVMVDGALVCDNELILCKKKHHETVEGETSNDQRRLLSEL